MQQGESFSEQLLVSDDTSPMKYTSQTFIVIRRLIGSIAYRDQIDDVYLNAQSLLDPDIRNPASNLKKGEVSTGPQTFPH
jgi:hypothetical protein